MRNEHRSHPLVNSLEHMHTNYNTHKLNKGVRLSHTYVLGNHKV